MEPSPRIGILGPLEVRGPAGPLQLGAAKERCLLSVLVVHAGSVVHRDLIVDALWDAAQPPSAINAVQNYVLRLRRGLSPTDGLQITTEPHGYRLVADRDMIDAGRAEDQAYALNRSPHIARSTSVVVLSTVVAPRTLPLLARERPRPS